MPRCCLICYKSRPRIARQVMVNTTTASLRSGYQAWCCPTHSSPQECYEFLREVFLSTARNPAITACRRLGRNIWKRWMGDHRRGLVETKMNRIKRLGERVMSHTFERQVNELHIRAAKLNRFTKLGRPQAASVA